ncbi:MAG: OB-fold domain-containing protein, partial [Deltaproteobacteria bacterium]|nr:OB-fold domain-containing protein [Deltaproteobacteria bacterium]
WSYTIITHPIDLAVEDKTPYNIVEIELLEQEGLRMISNLIDCKNEEIYIGMPVVVVFEEISPEITLPRFKKASF